MTNESFNFKRAYDEICNDEFEQTKKRLRPYETAAEEAIQKVEKEIKAKQVELEQRQNFLNAVVEAKKKLEKGDSWIYPSSLYFKEENFPYIREMVDELFLHYPSIESFVGVDHCCSAIAKERKGNVPWAEFLKNPRFNEGGKFLEIRPPSYFKPKEEKEQKEQQPEPEEVKE